MDIKGKIICIVSFLSCFICFSPCVFADSYAFSSTGTGYINSISTSLTEQITAEKFNIENIILQDEISATLSSGDGDIETENNGTIVVFRSHVIHTLTGLLSQYQDKNFQGYITVNDQIPVIGPDQANTAIKSVSIENVTSFSNYFVPRIYSTSSNTISVYGTSIIYDQFIHDRFALCEYDIVVSVNYTYNFDINNFAFPRLGVASGVPHYNLQYTSGSSLSSIIVNAINDASDIDTIISILRSIQSNVALMSDVLSHISNLDVMLSNVYNRLSITNSTLDLIEEHTFDNQLLIRKLLVALTGMSVDTSLDNATLIENARNYWIGIFQEAFKIDSEDKESMNSQREGLQGLIDSNEEKESQAFSGLDSALLDINFSPVAPAGIASTAIVIVGFINQLWNKLGSLQYLVIVTFTVGIITLILGRIHLR